jgi:hypothetical protein
VNASDISQPFQLRAEIAGTHRGALSGIAPTCVHSFEGPEVVGIGAAAIPEHQAPEVLGEHPALTVNREEGVA